VVGDAVVDSPGDGGVVDIYGNTIDSVAFVTDEGGPADDGGYGIYVDQNGGDSTAVVSTPAVVSDNVLTHVAGQAITVISNDLTGSDLSANTGTSDGQGTMRLQGVLTSDMTVSPDVLPLLIGEPSGLVSYSNEFDVAAGATLTLDAGTVVKAAIDGEPTALSVEGSLIADGTDDDPVTITSANDDSVGVNATGSTHATPAAGDWEGIDAGQLPGSPVPTVDLTDTVITYAATALADRVGSASLTGTVINDTSGVTGPAKSSDGSCPTGTVVAEHVNWGTPTGPAPYGTGPAVSGCVDVQPWTGEG
jgi:hypothetical protein